MSLSCLVDVRLMAFCYSCYIHFNRLSALTERWGYLPRLVRLWIIGDIQPMEFISCS
jgi:hypothetical protein